VDSQQASPIKVLTLDLTFSYQFGGYAYDAIYNDGFSGAVGDNFHRDYAKTWSATNPTGTLPRVFDGTTSYATSDLFIESSDYISLNNVSLGYTFDSDVVSKVGLSSLRIYALGNNIGLWSASGRQGFDPRASVTGGNSAVRYAPLKTYTLGVNINF